MDEKKLLSKLCKMYYYDELTQSQISEILKIERTKISRLLKRAKDIGIVKIIINDVFLEQLEMESELKKKYGLKEVMLVSSDEDILSNIARATHDYLQKISREREVVGITWGKTIKEFSTCIPLNPTAKIDFIALLGGYGNLREYMPINSMIYNLASSYKGTPYFLESPLIVDNPEVKEQIISSRFFSTILEIWDELKIVVVGIGAPEKCSNIIWETGLSGTNELEEFRKEIREKKAVGEICSKFYDIDGNLIKTELDKSIIGIELEKLRNIKYSIGIAGGKEKIDAICGAIKGKFINVLVTDMETAKGLMKKES